MYLQSIASAFPENFYSQRDCWNMLKEGPALDSLNRRSRKILETVLKGDSGIEKRHFALPPELLFQADAQILNENFEKHAPTLASNALKKACEKLGVRTDEVDAMFVTTCTGYLCPGVSSHVAERAGLRPDIYMIDLTGQGCGAAVPSMHAAHGFLAANPDALVATVSVEVCSAAFYLDDDTGVLVSACLFGDGSAAALWRGRDGGSQWRASNFHSLHRPEEREKIRFTNAQGRLRNVLDRAVPEVAAASVERLFAKRTSDPDQILAHTGGRDVVEAIEARLPQYRLTETRDSLRRYGNLSSPAVFTALEDRLSKNLPDRKLWLTAFGAGFAAYSLELTRD